MWLRVKVQEPEVDTSTVGLDVTITGSARMKHHQHRQLLCHVLAAVERTAREIADATTVGAYSISDKPAGSSGYDHVCTLHNGMRVTIRRVNPRQQSAGLQLEIRRPDGTTLRVPCQEPHIPWTPEDAQLAPLASGLAPDVLAVLAGATDVGAKAPIPESVL